MDEIRTSIRQFGQVLDHNIQMLHQSTAQLIKSFKLVQRIPPVRAYHASLEHLFFKLGFKFNFIIAIIITEKKYLLLLWNYCWYFCIYLTSQSNDAAQVNDDKQLSLRDVLKILTQ